MAEVKLVIKQIDQGSQGIKSIDNRLSGLLKTAGLVSAGLVTAGAAAKKAFDLSQEGASLNQLTASFDLMNDRVFQTPDLLDKMNAAAGRTIKQTDLMAGLMTLTAGATDEVAQSMAAASPQLIEIARAANKLNPQLGTTQFLYDSISKGIKRQSPLILDNLGIVVKAESAYRNYAASIGKSVSELDANERTMAFLNETLSGGSKLIDQVGGSVDNQADAWAKLTVRTQEATDAGKQYLANVLNPLIEALADTTDPIESQFVDINELAQQASSLEEFKDALQEANLLAPDSQTVRAWYDQGQAIKFTAAASDELQDKFQQVAHQQQFIADKETAARVEAGRKELENFGAAARLTSDEIISLALAEKELADQAQRVANAGLAESIAEVGGPISDLVAAQKLLADSQGEWVQVTRDNAGQISSINAELAADLSSEQKAAMSEILKTVDEGSAEWLSAYQALQGDLTTSQREALVAQRAELEAAQGGMSSAYTGNIGDAEAAQEAIEAANQAMIDSYRDLAFEGALALAELSPDPDAIQRTLDYAVAIGEMTQQEADLRLEAAQTRLAIQELNEDVVNGQVNAEKAGLAFDFLTSGIASSKEEAIQMAEKQQLLNDRINEMPSEATTKVTVETGGAEDRLSKIKSLLGNIDGRVSRATVIVSTNDSGGPPSESSTKKSALGNMLGAGEMSQVGEFNQPELFKSNGNLFLIPGDQGRVIPNSQMGGNGLTVNGPLIGQVIQRPGENGSRFASRVSSMVMEQVGAK